MWIFGIWILLVSEGASGNDTNCAIDSYDACTPPNTFPLGLPENEVEMQNVCSVMTEYMPCIRNHDITCEGSFDYEEEYSRIYGTLRRMCDEDSSLHKALKDNIKCMKKTLKQNYESCQQDVDSILRTYTLYKGKEFDEMTSEEMDIFFCLEHSFNIGCYLKNVEACGTEAKSVSIEIIQSSGFHLDGCPGDIKNTALLLLENLELEDNQEILISEVLLMSGENK